jgi:hypothetical protein
VRRVFAALAAVAFFATAARAQTHVLIVSGIGGESVYVDNFYEWGAGMADAALRLGIPRTNVVFLAEDSTRDPAKISGRSTKENIERTLARFAERAQPGDVVFVMLIGHGSMQGDSSRFSMPGADMSASDFARLLDRFEKQKVAFINASSSSGDFVKALSKEGRVVITATKTGFERNETMFPRLFVRAFTGEGADADKDNRVSMLEAFEYARKEVARIYEGENRLLTEHAILDDDGSGAGSTAPNPAAGDGSYARSIHLSQRLVSSANSDPRVVALYKEKQDIEDRLDALRRKKGTTPPAQYEQELEQLLVALAEKTQAIRKLEGGGVR